MDIPPKNEIISVDVLEQYIEKYPEDVEKWLEFIKDPAEDEIHKRRRVIRHHSDLNQEIYKANSDLHTVETNVPIEHYQDGCLFCKKSWSATQDVPTITLICGHKFHTLCSMIDQYNGDTTRCIVPDCDIDTWEYVRTIYRSKEKAKTKSENILLDALIKRKDFKVSLKELEQNISSVTSKYNAVVSMIKEGRKEFIHRHLYSINQIQNDLNEGVKYIKESQQMHEYKDSVRKYRKKASILFRKYHVSFRELNQRGLVRTSWRLRYVLERHRNSFTYYKMGINIYPGKKPWKDTLDQSDTDVEVQDDAPTTAEYTAAQLAALQQLIEEENV